MTLSIFKTIDAADAPTRHLGRRGEHLAARHLEDAGYRLILANFKVPVGRNRKGVAVTGEIDLIAIDGETLCFIEVKTRASDAFTSLLTAVDLRKQRQITRTAKLYARIFGVNDMPKRFDAVTVLLPPGGEPKLTVVKDFWRADKFQKRRWHRADYRDFY